MTSRAHPSAFGLLWMVLFGFAAGISSAQTCQPAPDGQGCESGTCSGTEQCLPKVVSRDSVTGEYTVVECECMAADYCHVDFVPNTGVLYWWEDFDDGDMSDWTIVNPHYTGDGPVTIEVSEEQSWSPDYSLKVSAPVANYYSGYATGPEIPMDFSRPYEINFRFRYHSFHWFWVVHFGPILLVMDQPGLPFQYCAYWNDWRWLGSESVQSFCPADTWVHFRIEVYPDNKCYDLHIDDRFVGRVIYRFDLDDGPRGFEFRERSGGNVDYMVDGYYDDVIITSTVFQGCTGSCPEGELCARILNSHSDGTITVECRCVSDTTAEACCRENGDCLNVDPVDCIYTYNGTPQGPGTNCTEVECPATEACCLSDGSCVEVFPHVCLEEYQGTPQGAGVDCVTADCPQPEACCLRP